MYNKYEWKNGDVITAERLNNIEDGIANCLPSGAVIAWHGNANSVPSGWTLCDGTNGTPDLRDKFVLGAGNSYAVGATGGEAEVTLTTSQMPAHTHSAWVNGEKALTINLLRINSDSVKNSNNYENVATSSVGNSQPHNNIPPFYALLYIMKL